MSASWHTNDHTPSGRGLSVPLRRTGSVTRSRSTLTPSVNSKRSSAFLNTSSNVEFGVTSPGVASDLMNESAGLRKTIEGLNKTNLSLRSRIAELETHIDHNTGPEVVKLNKELATLEDLFASSQKANEAQYAESERQKGYVKELENLLTTSLGSDWQESHKLYPPLAPTTIVTASTPLPPPKAVNTLRHSISFNAKRSSKKLDRRASSVMDLGLVGLQAVQEENRNPDDTPTGALWKLSGSIKPAHERLEEKVLCASPQPGPSTLLCSTKAQEDSMAHSSSDAQTLSGIDVNQLNQVLQMLSGLNPTKLTDLVSRNQSVSKSPDSSADNSRRERNDHIRTVRRILESQQKMLEERETRLRDILEMVSLVISNQCVWLVDTAIWRDRRKKRRQNLQ
ncbi:uncharacterized protein I206_102877 [Kwoniella pini CBS 10737]|uniref:Uncharacterized protein n=1 Tax=Kwoniella pini CBS 10737 TaxID=1296096 RepID=A0A1B9I6R1_9TREE|nr:uncharacterized protein I206_03227 [Kwoniella pini CBS 10737]OCF51161.1 hypothetical protein I206_03227 [Kwoniella pini CBS 10737]